MDKLFTFKRRELGFIELNLIPLVDVILNLLIFFLLVGSAMAGAIEVQLPSSNSASAIISQVPTVIIKNDNTVIFGHKNYSIESFKSSFTNNGIKSIIIQAEKSVSVQTLVTIMDIAKSNNIENVSIQTIPEVVKNEP